MATKTNGGWAMELCSMSKVPKNIDQVVDPATGTVAFFDRSNTDAWIQTEKTWSVQR